MKWNIFQAYYDANIDYYDIYNNKLNDSISVMVELVDVTDEVLADEEIE